MIHDDLSNIPTGREGDDVSCYHAFDKIIQVLLRPRPHQHGFGLFAREQAIEILRRRVMRKIGLPVPILFYEILVEDGQPFRIFLSGIPVSVDKGGCFEEIGRRFRCFLRGLLRGGDFLRRDKSLRCFMLPLQGLQYISNIGQLVYHHLFFSL